MVLFNQDSAHESNFKKNSGKMEREKNFNRGAKNCFLLDVIKLRECLTDTEHIPEAAIIPVLHKLAYKFFDSLWEADQENHRLMSNLRCIGMSSPGEQELKFIFTLTIINEQVVLIIYQVNVCQAGLGFNAMTYKFIFDGPINAVRLLEEKFMVFLKEQKLNELISGISDEFSGDEGGKLRPEIYNFYARKPDR